MVISRICDKCGAPIKHSFAWYEDDGDLCKKCFIDAESANVQKEFKDRLQWAESIKRQALEKKREAFKRMFIRIKCIEAKGE